MSNALMLSNLKLAIKAINRAGTKVEVEKFRSFLRLNS